MGWVIACGVLVLLAALPLGVSAKYDSEGALVRVILGPARLTVFPQPKKEKKEAKKAPAPEKKQDKQDDGLPKPPQPPKEEPKKEETPKEEKGGSWKDFLPLVKVVLDLLGAFRRKLRVNNLQLKLILAGGDPANLAINYGRTWAAVGNLLPVLERFFVIKKRDIQVECDFTAPETLVTARVDLTITLGRLLALVAVYGIRAVREFLNIQKKRKGGAVK